MTTMPPETGEAAVGTTLPSGIEVPPGIEVGAYSIASLLQNILNSVVEGFSRAKVSLPDRRYITVGTPAVDCEQVVVSFRQAYFGPPGDEAAEPQKCDGPRTAQVEVRISRCIAVPKGSRQTSPSAEDIQRHATHLMVDAWLLLDFAPLLENWNGVYTPGGLGVIGTVDAGEPQGMYQSTVLNLTIAIPGED